MMSILRTAADTGDTRRFVLVYGNRDADGITFREELDGLERRLDLAVFHVLSRPRPTAGRGLDGTYLAGRADPRRFRPTCAGGSSSFAGRAPAVDSSLLALEQLHVPLERIHAERFVEV